MDIQIEEFIKMEDHLIGALVKTPMIFK